MLDKMGGTAACTSRCGHNCCGSCGGRRATLELSRNEVDILRQLAQIPFLPVGRQAGSETPIYFESGAAYASGYGAAIISLFQKRLISLDYDRPLMNFDYKKYEKCGKKGSFALTSAGQQLVELLEIQGIER